MKDEDLLEEIKNPFTYNEVVHGTYYDVVELILKGGLNRMNRNHIRINYTLINIDFAIGKPGSNGVISGMRSSC